MAAGMPTINSGDQRALIANSVQNVHQWIESHRTHFEPPVGLKMLHDKQLQVFFVGGPNQRKDYHLQAGEELFYQVEGDMVLRVIEKGEPRDVPIRQGEIFLLPCRTQHSPQRTAKTVGMVAERERCGEFDGVRYFVEHEGRPTAQPLYEKYFNVVDLAQQLPPVLKGFFASEECRTGVPTGQHVVDKPPIVADLSQSMPHPISLPAFIQQTRQQSKFGGFKKSLFNLPSQRSVVDLYFGEYRLHDVRIDGDTLLWCHDGHVEVTTRGETATLKTNEVLVLPKNLTFSFHVAPNSALLFHCQVKTS